MRRCIRHLSYCLLACVMWANQSAIAAAAPADEPQDTQKSKQAKETPKETKKAEDSQQSDEAKKNAETKQADQTKDAKQTKPAEEAKPAEETKTPPEAKKEPATPPAKTADVEKGLLKIDVTLDGAFEAQKTAEIILRPKQWSMFKVLKAVEHGSHVDEGDLLVALDPEKIDEAIADTRAGIKASEVALKLAQQRLRALEATTPMDLAANRRNQKEAHEDTDHYFNVTRALALKAADFSLKSTQEYLENEEEELRQLEKMYKADELTEETEEIILKRQRSAVERAKFYLEMEKVDYEQTVKVQIPRRDVGLKEALRRADLGAESSQITLPLTLQNQRLEVEKLKLAQTRAQQRLDELVADRAAMTVKAPMAGVVYYGQSIHGKFSGDTSPTALRPFSSVPPNSVFMTIVKPRPMAVCVTVTEKQLQDVHAGVKGNVIPTAFPDLRLPAIVDSVAAVPRGAGAFEGRITVALDEQAEAVMPGMTCQVKLRPYLKKDALTVPPKSVGTDELDDQKHYVFRLDKKGKPQKRPVKVGRRTDTKVEILAGLAEGDKILAEYPTPTPAAKQAKKTEQKKPEQKADQKTEKKEQAKKPPQKKSRK